MHTAETPTLNHSDRDNDRKDANPLNRSQGLAQHDRSRYRSDRRLGSRNHTNDARRSKSKSRELDNERDRGPERSDDQ